MPLVWLEIVLDQVVVAVAVKVLLCARRIFFLVGCRCLVGRGRAALHNFFRIAQQRAPPIAKQHGPCRLLVSSSAECWKIGSDSPSRRGRQHV